MTPLEVVEGDHDPECGNNKRHYKGIGCFGKSHVRICGRPFDEYPLYSVVTRHTDGTTANMSGLSIVDLGAVVGCLENLSIIDCTISPER